MGEKLVDYDLILASASPRRTEILQQMGVRHLVQPTNIDETPKPNEPAVDYVRRMALEKAQNIIAQSSASIPVLGADTCVVCDAQIFGKPQDKQQALDMLLALSGRTHQVYTAVAVGNAEDCAVSVSTTEVLFRKLSVQECISYWETGEPKDKAGSYAIQGYGAVFIESINGSYSGVVGLPIEQTAKLLDTFGVPIWRSAKIASQ
jgi:septum formation protein